MQVQVLPPGMPSRPGEAVQYALSVRIDLQCRRGGRQLARRHLKEAEAWIRTAWSREGKEMTEIEKQSRGIDWNG